MRIVLASGSPRRKELLENLGLNFEIVKPDVEEKSSLDKPGEYVSYLSELKSNAVSDELDDDKALIIASDTIVWFEGRILEKPKSADEAFSMLKDMSGKSHEVYTAVSMRLGSEQQTFFEVTQVEFQDLDDDFISKYIASGEPMDKAGAYGIQGLGQVMVREIVGNYANVMGFPTSRFFNEVKKWLGDKSPI